MTSKAFVPSLSTVLPSPPGTAAIGTSADAAKADHVHATQAVPAASSSTPLVESGAGAVGSSLAYARADHVHPAASAAAFNVAYPSARAISLATAYQATDPTKAAIFTVNLNSSASFSLTGGSTNLASIVLGSTNAVASGTGSATGRYANSSTATVAVGVGVAGIAGSSYTFILPIGGYFAVLQTSGAVSITSCFEQAVG